MLKVVPVKKSHHPCLSSIQGYNQQVYEGKPECPFGKNICAQFRWYV